MHRGYIKLWRKSFDSGLHYGSKTWLLWTYILCNATHKEIPMHINGKTITLNPGDFLTGRKKLSAELMISERGIRTRLEHLESYGNIKIKATNRFSIISVVNWDIYQSDNPDSDQQNDQQNVQQLTNNRPAGDHKQEHKNVKNEKNTLDIPAWLDKTLWSEFKKFRQKGRGKFTPYAQKLAINKLSALRNEGNDPSAVIKQSIFRGWTGLFPVKQDKPQKDITAWRKRISDQQ